MSPTTFKLDPKKDHLTKSAQCRFFLNYNKFNRTEIDNENTNANFVKI